MGKDKFNIISTLIVRYQILKQILILQSIEKEKKEVERNSSFKLSIPCLKSGFHDNLPVRCISKESKFQEASQQFPLLQS